jgi:hypothetical protein
VGTKKNSTNAPPEVAAPVEPVDFTQDGRDPILASLRQLHEEAASEPIPERLLKLLAELDAREPDDGR